jgi:hypothetical protein
MKLLVKIIYKPWGIVLGVIAGLLSRRLFETAWKVVDEEEPPEPTVAETTWPKVLGAASLKAVTFSVTRAAVDRLGAQTFRHLFGVWPGDARPEGDD